MNNMIAQVTWSLADFEGAERMNAYTGWKENMNNVSAKTFADIAIVFSRKTRDWSLKNKSAYPSEIMGTSQLLIDKHIQHTFVLTTLCSTRIFQDSGYCLLPGSTVFLTSR
jgi:hypothetical protein